MTIDSHRFTTAPASIESAADDARNRMEEELQGLQAVERELDRLDRQLAALREQLVASRPRRPPEA